MDNTHTTTISNCCYFGTPIFWSLPMNSRPSRPPWPEPWKVVMFPHSCSTILEEEAGHRHRRCIFLWIARHPHKRNDGEMMMVKCSSFIPFRNMVFYDGEMVKWWCFMMVKWTFGNIFIIIYTAINWWLPTFAHVSGEMLSPAPVDRARSWLGLNGCRVWSRSTFQVRFWRWKQVPAVW